MDGAFMNILKNRTRKLLFDKLHQGIHVQFGVRVFRKTLFDNQRITLSKFAFKMLGASETAELSIDHDSYPCAQGFTFVHTEIKKNKFGDIQLIFIYSEKICYKSTRKVIPSFPRFLFHITSPLCHEENETQGQFFKRSLTGLTLELYFSKTGCHTKVKESSLLYYLSIAGERIVGFMPFPRVLVQWEMQTHLSGFELGSLCPFPMTITITPQII